MVAWEARDGVLGPAGRPYVKREYPMMLHKAKALVSGGIEITETQTVQTERERARLEPLGFRATPLEAIEALSATQTEHATLAAERNFEVRRMSPRAQLEVAQAEAEAGAVHLPTIPETPHGPRGVPVPVRGLNADEQALLDNADDTIRALQAELEALRAELATARAVPAQARKRGRPKKVAAVES